MPTPNAEGPSWATEHDPVLGSKTPLEASPPADNATVTSQSGQVGARHGPSTASSEPGPPSIPGYEIEGVLGRGGMGVVYKARHLALKRTVALKMILAGGHAGPRELARFRLEAEAVARLQHPNIVQIHEVGEAGGHPYCALEFAEGGNLAGKITGQPMPAREAARLVEALARAMQLAHSRNVVHRDLKPANVLLTADGTPKITDFGLARHLDSDSGQTQAGQVLGTPAYMAPEQAAGRAHEAGPAADVYALGAILYACLAGRPPFKGKSVVETLDQVRTQEPPPPSRWHKSVPLDLETICLKCLRKEPEKRYASAEALADDLGRYQAGEPILARPVGTVERAAKWVRRRPTAAALVAAVALLLTSATTFSLLLAERERKTSEDLANYNSDLLREQQEKDAALKAVRVGAARLALDRGLILCDQGDVARGLVALTRALAAAVEAGDADLESVVRFNLAAWERQNWRLRAVLPAPPGTWVSGAALSPQGTVLAVSLANAATELWDARDNSSGRVLRRLNHEGLVVGLSFSADGRHLLTRTDRAVHLWNVASGKPACPPIRHESWVLTAALSPDGKFILTGDEKGAARLWDAEGRQLGEALAHKGPVSVVAFRSDGLRVLTGTRDGKVRLWKAPRAEADGPEYALGSWVTTARFSPDGKKVLAGTMSGKVHLLDAGTGKPVFPALGHDGSIEEAVFGPDGTTLAVRTGLGPVTATARLWHTGTGLPIAPPLAYRGDVRCFAFSPDGQTILTAGRGGVARFWDTARGVAPGVVGAAGRPPPAPGPSLYHRDDVRAAAFSHDGRTLMTLDGAVRLWEAPRGFRRGPPLTHPGGAYAVAFSRDGKLVLTAGQDGTARLCHAATGQPATAPLRHGQAILAVAFSPDGRLVLTGGIDARLWETANGKLRATLEGHQLGIAAVAFSPDGKTVLTGSFDGTARLWNVTTGKQVGGPLTHEGPVQAVAFSPDGQFVLTGSDDRTARLWRVGTRQPVGGPLAHQSPVTAVAFASDGMTAYTGGRGGKGIRCWDTTTGRARPDLTVLQGGVEALAAAPAGRLMLSGGRDRTARFWDGDSGRQVGLTLQHQDAVRDVAFGPDGRTALTGSFDTTARRWHAPTGIPIGPPFLHRGRIRAVALSADGRTAGTASWDGTAVLWEAPAALPGAPARVALWAQVATGIDPDDSGAVRTLDGAGWQERRQRLGKTPGR
jgi:WD40 repeat protein